MVFKEIDSAAREQARLILVARNPEQLPKKDREMREAAELAIAGMVAGSPMLCRNSTAIKHQDFTHEGSAHQAALHTAMARLVTEAKIGNSVRENAKALAADTTTQLKSCYQRIAINAGFVARLPEDDRLICREAMASPEKDNEMCQESLGIYARMSKESQQRIRINLIEPDSFIPSVTAAIDRSVDKPNEIAPQMTQAYLHQRLSLSQQR